MDFLEIRRKAKERAAADAAQGKGAPAGPAGAAPPVPPPPSRAADPVLADADLVAGKVAAELQGIAASAELPASGDPRFTTWRPGSGERPFVGDPEAAVTPAPVPAPPEAAQRRAAPPEPPAPLPIAPEPAPPTVAPLPAPALPADPPPEPVRAARRAPVPERNPLEEFFYRDDEELPGVFALPGEAEAPVAIHEDGGIEEYLTFQLGDEEYAVAIEHVREVLKAQPITEVPRAPAAILGVVTVRGEVVAVFDPRRRLGLPGTPPADGTGRIVIVDDGEGPCGLLVDAVASVVRLAAGSIEPCPQGIGGASADCLAGIGRERQRLFTVLDLAALLRRAAAAPRSGRAHAGA